MNAHRAVAAAIVMLTTGLAGLQVAPAQTLPPAELPPAFGHGQVHLIKLALQLDEAQLERWAPLEAQLRAAIAARQKVRGGAFWPFLASLGDRQKEIAGVLLRPVVDEPWPSPVYILKEERDFKGHYRALLRGTTLHGVQRIRDERGRPVDDTVPTSYYYPQSPFGQTIALRRRILGAEKGRYGIVGVGAGAIACHKQEAETWRFFESDRVVVKIAKDPQSFTFISKCQPDIDIVMGDARLSLANEPDLSFDLLYIDPFFLDGNYTNLLTKEALELFLSKLKPDGVVLVHTSDRYRDLGGVLGANLKVLPEGTAGIAVNDQAASGWFGESRTWNAIFAKSAKVLEPYRFSLREVAELGDNGLSPRTDGNSDVWSAWRGK